MRGLYGQSEGFLSSNSLRPLIEFGALMERNGQVAVDVGGVLVPGPDFSTPFSPGKEEHRNGRARNLRPARQAEATPSAPTHSVGRVSTLRPAWTGNDITKAELEGLEAIFPDVGVVASSSRLVYLGFSIQPFPSLSDSARLLLEVPRPQYATVLRPASRASINDLTAEGNLPWRPPGLHRGSYVPLVPAVRAWAQWEGGITQGMPVLSHHRQPDLSICACMPYQWVRGVHPLMSYIGMCVTWFARVLHERDVGVYPGRQHYPEWSRIERVRISAKLIAHFGPS